TLHTSYFGQWHHFAGVYSNGSNFCRLYVDGVLKSSVAGAGPLAWSNSDLFFGVYCDPSLDRFYGFLDEVRIWNVARTQAQVQANMARRLSGRESGLVGY